MNWDAQYIDPRGEFGHDMIGIDGKGYIVISP